VLCQPASCGRRREEVGLLRVIERRLVEAGFAILRFNFAGIGRSTGYFSDGVEEPLDVAAAMETLRSETGLGPANTGVCGWSFGPGWRSLPSPTASRRPNA